MTPKEAMLRAAEIAEQVMPGGAQVFHAAAAAIRAEAEKLPATEPSSGVMRPVSQAEIDAASTAFVESGESMRAALEAARKVR